MRVGATGALACGLALTITACGGAATTADSTTPTAVASVAAIPTTTGHAVAVGPDTVTRSGTVAPAGEDGTVSRRVVAGRAYAVGDSVMLGARSCLASKRFAVDAVGSRQASAGAAVIAAHRRTLPPILVVHLGTNGGLTRPWVDRIMRLAGPQRLVVWLTLQLRNDYRRYTFENRSNTMLRAAIPRYPNARLADWNAASELRRTSWLGGDGIHLTAAGCRGYAALVRNVVRAG